LIDLVMDFGRFGATRLTF